MDRWTLARECAERRSRRRTARSRWRERTGRIVVACVALLLAFLLGMAFARTLYYRPQDARAVTSVRTLAPGKLDARTVTVTVTATTP